MLYKDVEFGKFYSSIMVHWLVTANPNSQPEYKIWMGYNAQMYWQVTDVFRHFRDHNDFQLNNPYTITDLSNNRCSLLTEGIHSFIEFATNTNPFTTPIQLKMRLVTMLLFRVIKFPASVLQWLRETHSCVFYRH